MNSENECQIERFSRDLGHPIDHYYFKMRGSALTVGPFNSEAEARAAFYASDLLAALRAAEAAIDFQLTNVNALANWMDEPTGLAIVYQTAEKCGDDLAAIRAAIAKATQ